MKRYLVSKKTDERIDFIQSKNKNKSLAIYNNSDIENIKHLFNDTIKLTDLYSDEIFLNILAKIDNDTTVFFIDLGLDYCSFKSDYIKPYMKLSPISLQCNKVFIIDTFAFYNIENSIYRPFLYIDDNILQSTVQEFYNTSIYKDYEGSKIENYYKVIKSYIDIRVDEIEIETIIYTPNEREKYDYENLKHKLIMEERLPKIGIINKLLNFIDNSDTKKTQIAINSNSNSKNKTKSVVKNTNRGRIEMYKNIINNEVNKVIFYSSEYYGVEQIELSRTKEAIERHNKLIRLINGKDI